MAKILVVDDAMFMRRMVSQLVESFGHEIVGEAGNGQEALEHYRNLTPDLVMMDITMPEVDGIEGVILIRNEFPDARIIICSAMGQQEMVVRAIQAGAKDFIVKPFQPDRVKSAIDRVLSK